jgi:hypothetical protein
MSARTVRVVGTIAGGGALAAAILNCRFAEMYGGGPFLDDSDANVPCGSFYSDPCPVDSGPINLEPDSGKADAHEGGERDARHDVEADAPLDAAPDASEDATDAAASDASSDALETTDASDAGEPDAPSDAGDGD